MNPNNFTYYNPVKIHFGNGQLNELSDMLGERRAILISSPGFEKRGLI